MKIRKAIIPCGGMGTRFLPVTKAVPKEILPVIDTPVIKYIADEIIGSGIHEILIIIGEGKEALREFFTSKPRLENALKNKPELLEQVREIGKNAEFRFAVQKTPRGSGDAVLIAKEFTCDEPFCMSNGDDLIVSDVPATKQLADAYEKDNAVVMGVQKVARSETDKYGIIVPTEVNGRVVRCSGMIEKPKGEPPSLYACLGRYVLTPEIYEYIAKSEEVGGELRLTDAICAMMKDGKAYAYEFDGRRYDMGDKFGALTATVDFALENPVLKDKFAAYIKAAVEKCV